MFQKFDWFRRVSWVSLQEYEQMDTVRQFNKKNLRKELHLITPRGKILKGFYAIRYLFLLFPATMILGVILFFPFTPLIGIPLYRFIAKNRHRFLNEKCKDGSCSL